LLNAMDDLDALYLWLWLVWMVILIGGAAFMLIE
jgi:hypothetical protein